jgi:hypothetical protein
MVLKLVEQKCLEKFEVWCWRRTENISWIDRVRNEVVLQRFKEESNILQRIKRRKANWIGHILRSNCRLKHVTEAKTEERIKVTGTRGRRHMQLRDDLKGKKQYWKLKQEAVARALYRTGFGRVGICLKDCSVNE